MSSVVAPNWSDALDDDHCKAILAGVSFREADKKIEDLGIEEIGARDQEIIADAVSEEITEEVSVEDIRAQFAKGTNEEEGRVELARFIRPLILVKVFSAVYKHVTENMGPDNDNKDNPGASKILGSIVRALVLLSRQVNAIQNTLALRSIDTELDAAIAALERLDEEAAGEH